MLQTESALEQIATLFERSHPQVVVVVGAGISIGATGLPQASWLGLLKHGIRHLIAERFQAAWGAELERSLDAAFNVPFNLDIALQHAELVEHALKTPDEIGFAKWLHSAFANFRSSPAELKCCTLDALADLQRAGAILMTTNYDSLLSDATGTEPVTWQDHDGFLRVMTRKKQGILHVHGHWKEPSSVILGRSSYERVVGDLKLQQLLRALWLDWTWLYVGCGNGMGDPNLGPLLEWSKDWGASAMADYFFAQTEKALELAARTETPANVIAVPYSSHSDLPLLLKSLSPMGRCSPFVLVDSDFPLFRVPNSIIPFPSFQEYKSGVVPSLSADTKVMERLESFGWAFVIDIASVGKTTLALRLATSRNQQGFPAFYLDLKDGNFDDGESHPSAALDSVCRRGNLIIVDNLHHAPAYGRKLWQRWNAKPAASRGHLLLIATRIEQTAISPEEDLAFFEWHSRNPAVVLDPTPQDFGHIACFIAERLIGGGTRLSPPAEVMAEWQRIYRASLNAFTFVVTNSLRDLERGRWDLPPVRASEWIRKHWLDSMSVQERENVFCLAVLGRQEMELVAPAKALPYPAETARLKELRLIYEIRLNVQNGIALRESGWGDLILAASRVPVDREEILFRAALAWPQFAGVISSRLKAAGRTDCWQKLWTRLEGQADQVLMQLIEAPLGEIACFIRQCYHSGADTLALKIWAEAERRSDSLLNRAAAEDFAGLCLFLFDATAARREFPGLRQLLLDDLDKWIIDICSIGMAHLADLLRLAREQRWNVDSVWVVIERNMGKLIESVWHSTAHNLLNLLHEAKTQGRDETRAWELLVSDRDKLIAHLLEISLADLAGFFQSAKALGHETAPLWELVEDDPVRIIALGLGSPLHFLGTFLQVAKAQERDVSRYWTILGSDLVRLAECAWNTPFDGLRSFFEVAWKQEWDVRVLWDALERDPQRLCTKILAGSLDKVASLIEVAKSQHRDAKTIWELIDDQQDAILAKAWISPPGATTSFLKTASDHGQGLVAVWKTLLGQPERLHDLLARGPFDGIANFADVASASGYSLDELWRQFRIHPDDWAARAMRARTGSLVRFASVAPPDILRIAARDIKPGHWADTPATVSLLGATWLISAFLKIGRSELASDLEDTLLRRSNPVDFYSGFSQGTWLIANSKKDVSLLERFVGQVCTKHWLNLEYRYSDMGTLASGLFRIIISRGPRMAARFHHRALNQRLFRELGRLTQLTLNDQSKVIECLGSAALCGRTVSHLSVAQVPPHVIAELARRGPTPQVDAARNEYHLRQLWLGVRTYVSVLQLELVVGKDAIQRALDGWSVPSGDLTANREDFERLKESMIEWLELGMRFTVDSVLPASEPLWAVSGFSAVDPLQ